MAGDARLLKASLRGDHEAFARIVRRYQSLVCAITYSGTGDLSASEDLAQETFLTAWKRLGSLREPKRLRPWLCAIARNRTADWLRRRQRDPMARALPVEEAPSIESATPTPAERAVLKERERLVWEALHEIPETYRVPLVLYYREQQSVGRVARELELSRSAVKLRLMRGRGMLRDKVAALVEDTLSATAPGGAFAVAVVAALAGTAAKKATGAGSTILGLSLAKAAAVGVLAAGVSVGGGIALHRAAAPEPEPAVAPVAAPEPAQPSSWLVYTDALPDNLLAFMEIDLRLWHEVIQALVPLTKPHEAIPSLSELVLEVCHTDDMSTVDLTRPAYGITVGVENLGGLPFVFWLTDPNRYMRSLDDRHHKIDGEGNLYVEGPEEIGTVIAILGDRAIITHGGVAKAKRTMDIVRQGALPSERCFPPYAIGAIVNVQPILTERARPGDKENPFNGLRERIGITRNGQPAGPNPLSGLVDDLEDVCLRQWDRYALAVGITDDDASGLWQFRTADDTPLQRAVAEYPAGPVGLLRFVPADSLAVLACKLPDLSPLVAAAGLPPGSLPGRALALLDDEIALALGRSPEGTIRLVLALRVRDPEGAGRLMDEVAALASASLAGPAAPLRLSRSETQHNGEAIKVWDFDVVQPAQGAVGLNAALGKDLKVYECLVGDALLLAFGGDVLSQVQAALDGTLEDMADSPRFAEAMTGMPTSAPLVCCVEGEKLCGWIAQLLVQAVPAFRGLDFGDGPPVLLVGHVIEGRLAELRFRLPLGAVAAGVKWRNASPPPPRPAAPVPAPMPPPSLHGAAGQSDLERLRQLLAEGEDVNARDPAGRTPLHFAAEAGHAHVVQLLLANGADANAEDARRRTPLHLGAQSGRREAAEALLEAGAAVNATDLNGWTPTGYAVRAGHRDLAAFLAEHGGVE